MSKSIIHSKITAKKLKIDVGSISEIDEMIDSSKQFESSNNHRIMFHHAAGCFYMQKMFAISFEKLETLMEKYNLPQEFIADYINQRFYDRNMGTELQDKTGKRFIVRDIVESHILQDFKQKIFPSFSDYIKNINMPEWINNGVTTQLNPL